MIKRCCRCKVFLPINCFFKNRSRKDGYHHQCKECAKLYDFSGRPFLRYRYNARIRNIEFILTEKQFEEILKKRECFYCGDKNSNGLDRVDNKKGYILNNVVPCCKMCNRMKMTLLKKQFLNHCKKIVDNLKL